MSHRALRHVLNTMVVAFIWARSAPVFVRENAYTLWSGNPNENGAFLNQLFETNPTQPELAFYLIGKFGLENLHFWSFFGA